MGREDKGKPSWRDLRLHIEGGEGGGFQVIPSRHAQVLSEVYGSLDQWMVVGPDLEGKGPLFQGAFKAELRALGLYLPLLGFEAHLEGDGPLPPSAGRRLGKVEAIRILLPPIHARPSAGEGLLTIRDGPSILPLGGGGKSKMLLWVATSLLYPPAAKVALIYSDYGNYRHRDDYDRRIPPLGWFLEKFENTKFTQLVGRLSEFDIVIGSALYNYSNEQDFSAFRREMVDFMERGGAFVFTDVNYVQHVRWLKGFGEGYEVEVGRCKHSGEEAKILEPHHPLLCFPHRWRPRAMWAHMRRVGPKWRVLAHCPDGSAIWAVSQFGKGFMWLSSFWPLSPEQLQNLWEYVRMRRAGVDISAVEPLHGTWGAGVVLRLRPLRGGPREAEVRWRVRALPSGRERVARRVVKLDGETEVRLPVRPPLRGEVECQLSIVTGAGRYDSAPVRATVPELLELAILKPPYRGSVYLALPPKDLLFEFSTHPLGADLSRCRLEVRLEQAGGVLGEVREEGVREGHLRFHLPLPEKGLSPAPIEVLAKIVNPSGEEVFSRSWEVPVVPKRPGQVFLGPNLETRVKGELFMPIGVYHINPKFYGMAKRMGFNCVQAWGTKVEQARKALDEAQRHGLKVLLEMSTLLRGRYDRETFKAIVKACKGHPALLAWYPVDEPGEGQFEWCLDAYRICRELDPHHPVYLVICDPRLFAKFAGATDILAIDPYPVPHAPINLVSRWAHSAWEAVRGRKAVWLVPQLHNTAAYRDPKKGRAPTPEEVRCMVYQGLIYGAKGIVYYTWDDRVTGLVHEPALLRAVPELNRELLTLAPLLLTARRRLLCGLPNDRNWHIALFTGRKDIVLATNTGDSGELAVRLPGPFRGEEILFGRGEAEVEGAFLRLRAPKFGALAVELVR